MANPSLNLTDAELSELTDVLIKLIVRSPRVVGTEPNWSRSAAESILDFFELDGVDTPTGLGVGRIARLIELRTTPSSRGYISAIAELILVELGKFMARREDAAKQPKEEASTGASLPPSDETHQFAVMPRNQFEAGREPVAFVSEADALDWISEYRKKSAYPNSHVILARPKPEPWIVLNYED